MCKPSRRLQPLFSVIVCHGMRSCFASSSSVLRIRAMRVMPWKPDINHLRRAARQRQYAVVAVKHVHHELTFLSCSTTSKTQLQQDYPIGLNEKPRHLPFLRLFGSVLAPSFYGQQICCVEFAAVVALGSRFGVAVGQMRCPRMRQVETVTRNLCVACCGNQFYFM